MRDYGNVQTSYWTHPDIIQLSDQAKLLGAYLLSSTHTTMLGCYRIPLGYIAEDLKWDIKVVEKAITELSNIQFLSYDETSNWVFIHTFLKHQPIENPNQGRCIAKLFQHVPRQVSFYISLVDVLLKRSKYLDEGFCKRLETLFKPFQNQNQYQDQDQDPDQDQKQECLSGTPDIDHKNIYFKNTNHSDELRAQAVEILNFLNEKAGKAFQPTESNLKLIKARLKSGASVMECRQVIVRKCRAWKDDPKMQEYLRPATLFNAEKFEQYRGELVVDDKDEQDALS